MGEELRRGDEPVTRNPRELWQRLGATAEELACALGRPPTVAELAERLSVNEEQVLDARAALAARSSASLDHCLAA